MTTEDYGAELRLMRKARRNGFSKMQALETRLQALERAAQEHDWTPEEKALLASHVAIAVEIAYAGALQ